MAAPKTPKSLKASPFLFTWSLELVALPEEGSVAVLDRLCAGLLAEHNVAQLLVVLRALLLPAHQGQRACAYRGILSNKKKNVSRDLDGIPEKSYSVEVLGVKFF